MLEEAKVMLSDGWSFGGAPTAHFQRINVACSRQVLLEGLGRIAAAVTKRRPMV
jgi:bifunctional pyridoxal-dependent enzyme with beta-cystathionase and maltose regulon repressor activities